MCMFHFICLFSADLTQTPTQFQSHWIHHVLNVEELLIFSDSSNLSLPHSKQTCCFVVKLYKL